MSDRVGTSFALADKTLAVVGKTPKYLHMLDLLFSHDEALHRLDEDRSQCAFAFYPKHSAGDISGGVIFFLEPGDPMPQLRVFRGRFFTGSATTGVYNGKDAELYTSLFIEVFGVDPRTLRYKACTPAQIETALHCAIERNVSVLNGHHFVPLSDREITPEWESLLFQHMPKKSTP